MHTHAALFTDDGTVRYAFEDGVWFIKLLGAVCHPLGPTLNALVDKIITTPHGNKFVIDLTEADTIDSTCLGILTRIATHAPPTGGLKPIIITGGGNIAKTVLIVRFDRLFELVDSLAAYPSKMHTAPKLSLTKEDTLQLLLDAHRQLCTIDAQTHDAFQDVVKALETDALIYSGKRNA